jgi:hypothetical protein
MELPVGMLHGSANARYIPACVVRAELLEGLERGIHQSTFEAVMPISPRQGNAICLQQAPTFV